ncbi:hypothetical protein [Nocardioides flavescens]|uniref:WD40 repeat domain-containing protein n=1 Tax=Nocardioides flavescens TaxID=2691959 RepID=A0A6L7ELX7_9ACTN|nr:hypothetical protein [Nocardioides flavescens]MXG88303.1 hypothetical protein [Nocardioides flavescens]
MSRLEHDIRQTLQAQASVDLHDPGRLERVRITRRRQQRMRRLTAGAVTIAAVLAIAVTASLLPRDVTRTEPVTGPGPTTGPGPVETSEDAASVPPAPAIDELAVRATWDPASAATLPTADEGLPADLDPIQVRTTGPLSGAALALAHEGGALTVLDAAGWMRLPTPPGLTASSTAALAPDGRKAAVVTSNGLAWLDLTDLPAASWIDVETPRSVRGEGVQITWFPPSDQVVLNSWRGGQRIDLVSGSVLSLPFLQGWAPTTVTPDGEVLAVGRSPRTVDEWVDDVPVSSIPIGGLEGIGALTANRTTVAATRIDTSHSDPGSATDRDGLAVFDRTTASTWAFLAFTGRSGQWVDGGEVVPVQWLASEVLLLSVLDPATGRRTLVRWTPQTSRLWRVSSYDAAFAITLAQLD